MVVLYGLIDCVKVVYFGVEIESCCFGGGCVDLGILVYIDWFWMFDLNDVFDCFYI